MLGNQCVLLRGDAAWPWSLWVLGIALWLVLTYAILTGPDGKAREADARRGAQRRLAARRRRHPVGLACSAACWPGSHPAHREELLFFALAIWLVGGMLYIWIIALIFYRFIFLPLEPGDLTPPYWINMGAMAISTLAGTTLIAHPPGPCRWEKGFVDA